MPGLFCNISELTFVKIASNGQNAWSVSENKYVSISPVYNAHACTRRMFWQTLLLTSSFNLFWSCTACDLFIVRRPHHTIIVGPVVVNTWWNLITQDFFILKNTPGVGIPIGKRFWSVVCVYRCVQRTECQTWISGFQGPTLIPGTPMPFMAFSQVQLLLAYM